MKMRWPLLLGIALTCGLGQAAQALDAPGNVLAHASIDPNLFRDGEVHRLNQSFGQWSLDCDEVPRLSQRFCSLRAVAVDGGNTPLAMVTISTDEAGRPAALLDVPPSTDLTEPIVVTAATPLLLEGPSKAVLDDVRKRTIAPGERRKGAARATVKADVLTARLPLSLCEPQSCQTVWPLKPADIAALRAGSGLRMTFRVVLTSLGDLRTGALRRTRTVEAVVGSEGFDDAIKSSVR